MSGRRVNSLCACLCVPVLSRRSPGFNCGSEVNFGVLNQTVSLFLPFSFIIVISTVVLFMSFFVCLTRKPTRRKLKTCYLLSLFNSDPPVSLKSYFPIGIPRRKSNFFLKKKRKRINIWNLEFAILRRRLEPCNSQDASPSRYSVLDCDLKSRDHSRLYLFLPSQIFFSSLFLQNRSSTRLLLVSTANESIGWKSYQA